MAVSWCCRRFNSFSQIRSILTVKTAPFHSQSIAFFRTSLAITQKPKKISYEDLPQPELKPMGPQDYMRWKYFLNNRRPSKPDQTKGPAEQLNITNAVVENINHQIDTHSYGRLFAVVQIAGKQFKITHEDIIVVQGYFAPAPGDVIRLEKILMVGCSDFTLIGRPLLNKDSFCIEATVIEKTFSQVITHFVMLRRKNFRRTRFYRTPHTLLRINAIDFKHYVNEKPDVEGLEDRILN